MAYIRRWRILGQVHMLADSRKLVYFTDNSHTVGFAAGDTCVPQITTPSSNMRPIEWLNWCLLLEASA